MLGRKAFPFQAVNLFFQNCIGSLVGEREVISGFVDHEFKEILILSLLSCSSSTPKTHFSSYRSSPCLCSPLLPLILPCPFLFLLCLLRGAQGPGCGPLSHSDVFYIFFLFFEISNTPWPFSTAEHWAGAHRPPSFAAIPKNFLQGNSSPRGHHYVFIVRDVYFMMWITLCLPLVISPAIFTVPHYHKFSPWHFTVTFVFTTLDNTCHSHSAVSLSPLCFSPCLYWGITTTAKTVPFFTTCFLSFNHSLTHKKLPSNPMAAQFP